MRSVSAPVPGNSSGRFKKNLPDGAPAPAVPSQILLSPPSHGYPPREAPEKAERPSAPVCGRRRPFFLPIWGTGSSLPGRRGTDRCLPGWPGARHHESEMPRCTSPARRARQNARDRTGPPAQAAPQAVTPAAGRFCPSRAWTRRYFLRQTGYGPFAPAR